MSPSRSVCATTVQGLNRLQSGPTGGPNPGNRWSQSVKSGGSYPRKSGGPNRRNRLVPIRGNRASREDWALVVETAQKIADHAEPPASESKLIRDWLGAN